MELVSPIRVAVIGGAGRMGRTVCHAINRVDDLDLVAVVDPASSVEAPSGSEGIAITAEVAELEEMGVEVVVDFTVAQASRSNLPLVSEAGIHAVVGTSGLDEADFSQLKECFTSSNCVVAPNFAIGAVLMMRFSEMAAPWFDTVEVIEFHHDGKVDAPSGTALATADRLAKASANWADNPTTHETLVGARGAAGPSEIRLHAVRMRGMMAHQEVLLGTDGQTLSIRHDSVDRESFMPGVLLAIRGIAQIPGLTIGLDTFLDL